MCVRGAILGYEVGRFRVASSYKKFKEIHDRGETDATIASRKEN